MQVQSAQQAQQYNNDQTGEENMFSMKKKLTLGLFITLTSISAYTATNNVAPEGSLKLVMQGLLKDTQQLTAAMLTEDFVLIEKLSGNIAKHPKPSMATRMKLMKAMGSDMAKFKANDDVVHSAAVAINESAQQQDIKAAGEHFKKLIGGCLSCHVDFKNRVADILK